MNIPPFLDIAYRRRYDWQDFHNRNAFIRTVYLKVNLPDVPSVEANESGRMEQEIMQVERFNVTYVESAAIASLNLT
jgi:hypothetical protein